MQSWFAVMTRPREESQAQGYLGDRGYETWYPHYWEVGARGRFRKRLLKKPYLSRYIFVGLGADQHSKGCPVLWPINNCPNISTIVYAPGGIPFPIPQPVMDELMGRADEDGCIEGTKKKPRFSAIPGDKVVLAETSPYWNFICEVARVDHDNRIVVLLDTMGRKVPSTILAEDVEELHTQGGIVIPKGDPRMWVRAA